NVTINANPVATATSNSPVCVGKPLTLTGGPNGMTTYSWSGPLAYSNNTQSPTVSASATAGMAGIYTITVTNGNGCTSTASTNVVINAVPVATATSNSPVCVGKPLTLTGGPNGMTTYSWSGPLAYSNNTQSPTVSATATLGMAGTYTITITNGNGCTSTASTVVVVNANPLATASSNSPVCIGQPLTLTGGPNGMTTYSWSGPLAYSNNTQSPTVSASATAGMAGIYTITVTNANGCTSTAATNVTVNASPVATAVSNSPVCVGKPLTLTGGPNGMASYSWSGPLAYSNNTQSPTVSASATAGMAGIYTITVTNAGGCTSTASTNVIVNALPVATAASNSPVCIGQPLTLTGGPNGMTTYLWSGPLAYSNNTQSPTVSASATAGMAGIYTITVTNANGCTSTATTNVTVNALPVATAASNSPVCIGQPLTLTGGPNGMTTYSWSGPLAYSNNTQSPTVSASATAGMAGIYTITVTNGNGCTSTASTNVTINANPVATATSNSPVCVGKPLTLTGGPNGMTSYSWSGPLAYSNNTQSPTVSATATLGMAGTYTITITNGNGCTSTASTVVVVNANPLATATSNSPVCIGQPLTLTGGPNGMTTYSWSGPLAYSNNTQSPTVSASATAGMAGIYTITVTNGNGCTSTATTNVTINANPVATATSNSPVCVGKPLTLTGGPNGMTTYSWSGPLAYSN
ncbi:MAG: hypothetical protein HY840_13765, partial [Bacteroidetes bacterium]|nr:hypothetical protein [Bacteroidota bacterium]